MCVIAVDLGGTKIACGTFNSQGNNLNQRVIELQGKTGTQAGVLITDLIKEEVLFVKSQGLSLSGIGISVPGIYYPETGSVWAPNIEGWQNYELLKEVSATEELNKIPVRIESDRACYILGESGLGCARGCSNAIFLAVGTGIGAGILADGRVLHGHNDIAGAVGWFALDRIYSRAFKQCGHFEYYASGQGMVNYCQELIQETAEYQGVLKSVPESDLVTADIFSAYDKNDEIARLVLDLWPKKWYRTSTAVFLKYVNLYAPFETGFKMVF